MSPQVYFSPNRKSIQVRKGLTLLEAGNKARVIIRTRCGGNASCLMCKVIVADQSGITPLNLNEQLKLGDLQNQGYRLACQAHVVDDTHVEIPEDPLKAAIRLQLAKQKEGHEL